jgi:hypothetical protein
MLYVGSKSVLSSFSFTVLLRKSSDARTHELAAFLYGLPSFYSLQEGYGMGSRGGKTEEARNAALKGAFGLFFVGANEGT